jgi:hypothetical protein
VKTAGAGLLTLVAIVGVLVAAAERPILGFVLMLALLIGPLLYYFYRVGVERGRRR